MDSIKKKGKSYSKKYAKYLTAEQEKQLAAGKKINTSNIKNANVKKIIDQYNVDLQNAMNSYTAATQLTEFGALSIVLNAKQLDTSLTTLKDYVKKRQQIMDDFKAEKFGQETYDKLMAENDSSLQNALKNAQSYQQAILGIIKNQAKAEQDALFKVIDARKDALKKKKDY